MKIFTLLFAPLCFLGFAAAAGNLISNADTAAGWPGSEAADNGLRITSEAVSGEFIPVDPRKQYRLKATIDTAVAAEYYVGLIPFDAQKRQIQSVMFHVRPGSETVLVKACAKDDKLLVVDNAAKWTAGRGTAVAFDVDDSGNYNDLPNFNTSACVVLEKQKQADGSWLLTLEKPVGFAYPAGTAVRQHSGYAHYIFGGKGRVLAKGQPEAFDFNFSDRLESSAHGDGKFWPGTAYVKVVLLNFVKRPFTFSGVSLQELE